MRTLSKDSKYLLAVLAARPHGTRTPDQVSVLAAYRFLAPTWLSQWHCSLPHSNVCEPGRVRGLLVALGDAGDPMPVACALISSWAELGDLPEGAEKRDRDFLSERFGRAAEMPADQFRPMPR